MPQQATPHTRPRVSARTKSFHHTSHQFRGVALTTRNRPPRGREYAFETLCERGHDPRDLEHLRASLTSRYHRLTLLLPEGSRATFDTRLHWQDDSGRTVSLPGHAIVETKSSGAAGALDRALWRAGHRPTGISKFGTGTAALHPELPRNKWVRVLRDHFETAPRDRFAEA